MKKFIEFIAKQLVDNPDEIRGEETTPDEHTIALNPKVDKTIWEKLLESRAET